jgi:hypothetical protein
MGGRLPTHLEASVSGPILPWRTERAFRLWRYGVGHSQLLLRSPGDAGRGTLSIQFEAVEFMKLRRSYTDLVLRLPREDEEVGFEEIKALPVPQLCVVLDSRTHIGLVACSRVTARMIDDPESDSWDDGTVLFSVTRRSKLG